MRRLTPSEMEDNTVARIEAGAVGCNVVACRCGRVIGYFPDGPVDLGQTGDGAVICRSVVFVVPSCDWCWGRDDLGLDAPAGDAAGEGEGPVRIEPRRAGWGAEPEDSGEGREA